MNAAAIEEMPQSTQVVRTTLAAALLASFALLMAGSFVLGTRHVGVIEELQLEAPLKRVSVEQIRKALDDALGNGLLGLDLDAARLALEQLPWVSQARIERVWPAALRVRVWERAPQARWGEHALLDADAESFTPAASEIPQGLPELDGPRGQAREVLETFERLQMRLRGTRFALAGLRQDARREWFARTQEGIELRLGRGTPEAHLPLLLGPVARALADHLDDVAHIDLRYTNGFAVALREPDKTIRGEKHG